ncbi:hypothetical protein Bbelb_318120 [Branchiostoma belcheri]|nr:hypothetical protein Bbelb_318120 [Branchiostoma belcheri]
MKILNGTNEKQSSPLDFEVFQGGKNTNDTRRQASHYVGNYIADTPTRDALQGLIDYRLAENAVYRQRKLRTTNKCESFHIRVLKAASKAMNFERNYTGRRDILEQKIKLSGYTISYYSREEMETAIGNIPIEVRSRHNARLVNQLIVKANTGQDETTLTRPSTLLTHLKDEVERWYLHLSSGVKWRADNVLLKRGAEGHLAFKLIDFGSACYECYPCTFDVREEKSSHIAAEVMKGGAVSTRSDIYSLGKLIKDACLSRRPVKKALLKIVQICTKQEPSERMSLSTLIVELWKV